MRAFALPGTLASCNLSVSGAELTRSERLIRWKCVFIRSKCPLPFAFGHYWLASDLGRFPFESG
jgi:hypothetical protein